MTPSSEPSTSVVELIGEARDLARIEATARELAQRRRSDLRDEHENGATTAELCDRAEALRRRSRSLLDEAARFEAKAAEGPSVEAADAAAELARAAERLAEVDFILELCEGLAERDRAMRSYSQTKDNKDPVGEIAALVEATKIASQSDRFLDELDICRNFDVEIERARERALDGLSDEWNKILSWSETEDALLITIDVDKLNKQDRLLKALVSSEQMFIEIKKFSRFLLEKVLKPLINRSATVDTESKLVETLKITFQPNPKGKNTKVDHERVLSNLKRTFEFLATKLANAADVDFVKIVGDFACADFSDALIKDCLVHTIPNCIQELQDYGSVTAQVETFQKYLSGVGFFDGDDEASSILRYASNIDVLFANKTSQYFLESARAIVKRDLGNTMSVGSETATPEAEEERTEPGKATELDEDERELMRYFYDSFEASPFRFPRCAISRSVHELLDLVVLMMEQAAEASDLCARRLYYTARNVFELYAAIVPLHHKALLETMPQQIALFHNNCVYLAHHLLILGPKWQKNFSGRQLDYNIVFYDQVKELRDLATHTLLTHMRYQRKQILDTIRASDIYYIAIKDTLSDNAEQAIRQCIRQLQVLKTVWSGIFPSNVYRRLITCLANVFVEELVCKVVNQEDITAEVASQLADIYKIVQNRLPQIYDDESIIHKNVQCWMKFNELIFVLHATLATIEERWFNGSGPLAAEFKPDEIKRLIRALFQNTTVRANLLAKIK